MASTEDLFPTQPATADTAVDNPTRDNAAGESLAADAAAAESGATAVAPTRKRAPRRATKKASAPAPATATDQPTGDIPGEVPGEVVGEALAAEAAEPGERPAEQATDAAPAAKTAKKGAKKAAKRSGSRGKKAAEAAAQAPGVPVGEISEATGTTDDVAVRASVDAELARVGEELRTTGEERPADQDSTVRADEGRPARRARRAAAEVSEPFGAEAVALDDDEAESEEPAEQAPAPSATVPSFGVLFQAPEPATVVAPRRRQKPQAEEPVELTDTDTDTDTAERDEVAEAESEDTGEGGRRRRRRGGKGRRGRAADADSGEDAAKADRAAEAKADSEAAAEEAVEADTERAEVETDDTEDEGGTTRRRRRRRRSGAPGESEDPPGTVTKVRESRRERDEPQSVKGSTRLEAKKQRRREGREAGRRRTIITEAEFLARRESVERVMVVREREGRTQIGVLEDGVLVEHYVSRETNGSLAGNVYLGRVQNVLPSMEAAFVDIGKGRNAVLYAGEVNWDAAGLENNQPRRIENALKSGDSVLVQVTKDPIGHKGARLTSQISLPGRYLVYVPEGNMTGISRKLPDTERSRLKSILKEVVPDSAGVIVRTAAEGASEEELRADVERLTRTWDKISQKAEAKSSGKGKGGAPMLVHGEPDLTVRVIRDVFNEDFTSLVVAGDQAYAEVSDYLNDVAPDLAERLTKWTAEEDLFTRYRVDEQIAKAMDRKVWLPSGGSLVIDRTEAMTVIDVNTGKFVGSGGNLEETVTKNNIEAAEEIVRQLRLRDIGGIIVIDFIDMVLESNRDLVVRRLLECLGRDRTKHQVAEVTSLGLVQMTRKRVGSGLIEVFSETCEHCNGRGIIVHADPVEKPSDAEANGGAARSTSRSRRGKGSGSGAPQPEPATPHTPSGPTPAQIAAAAHAAAIKSTGGEHAEPAAEDDMDQPVLGVLEIADQEAIEELTTPAAEPLASAADGAAPVTQTRAPEPVGASVDAGQAEPAPAPKRRKRGRVVAPAGPPRAAAAEPVSDTAEGIASDAS